jgi:conserved oligomeric Golgi complex subunit 4
LKPGEGLLVGSANYLTSAASQLMRQGVVVTPSVVVPAGGGAASASAAHKKNREELERHQKQQLDLARACAVLNDLEVATHHTRQLELLLHKSLDKSFAPPAQQQQHLSDELQQQQHEVEQLRMCVRQLSPVADQMQAASDAAIESLESVLRPRIRSIVGDAVGSEASPASSAFMIGAATVGDRHRDTRHGMNYKLDEEAYNLLQLSEGYVARLCTLMDEMLLPLQRFLAPRLWDKLLLGVVSTAGKRLDAALRKCQFTALGGLALDADMRDLLHYTKERLHAADSNPAIFKACPTLSRLLQVGQLLSVDDLEDVTDLIHSSKRKGLWDLKMDDVKAFLSARVEFDAAKVDELLHD